MQWNAGCVSFCIYATTCSQSEVTFYSLWFSENIRLKKNKKKHKGSLITITHWRVSPSYFTSPLNPPQKKLWVCFHNNSFFKKLFLFALSLSLSLSLSSLFRSHSSKCIVSEHPWKKKLINYYYKHPFLNYYEMCDYNLPLK